MRKYVKIARSFLKLLLSSRPKVFWWSIVHQHKFAQENFGDIITPYIVEKLTGRKPMLFFPNSRFANYFRHTLMTGSIINMSQKKSVVWGSGVIKRNEQVEGGNFLAVRGPHTAARLAELGFKAPDIYGDPGILLPLLYHPKIEKKYKSGVIAHYVDADKVAGESGSFADILHIDLLTDTIEPVIDKILQCDRIVSTSLHGIIVAHSYGIPALWWKYSDKLSGDDIKFYDYFESVGLRDIPSNQGKSLHEILEKGFFHLPDAGTIAKMQSGLLDCFPYKLKQDYAGRK